MAGPTIGGEPSGEFVIAGGDDLRGEQRGVRRPRHADRERRHRHPGRHLDNREQGVLTLEVSGGHRHAEHWHLGLGGQHPRKVRGAPGTGDDRPEPTISRRLREGEHLIGHTVSREHSGLVRHTERIERLDGGRHRRPIARRTHHDGHEWGSCVSHDPETTWCDGEVNQINVLGTELQPCSYDPLTGYYRTGCCENRGDDPGMHVVCCRVTDDFLEFSRSMGNDLSTPMPQYGFSGLSDGDQWCVCAMRWREALEAGRACPVVLESTHISALEYVDLEDLRSHAIGG